MRCEYLVEDRFCQAIEEGEGRKVREQFCKNKFKNSCCYLCNSRASCNICCMYLETTEDVARLGQEIDEYSAWNQKDVKVVTTPDLPGYEIIEVLGPVHGLTVRTRGIGGKFLAGIEGMFGGEVTTYSSECEKARGESLRRLIEDAKRLGANAIIAVDFETSDILQGTAVVFSTYGTAVTVKSCEKKSKVV